MAIAFARPGATDHIHTVIHNPEDDHTPRAAEYHPAPTRDPKSPLGANRKAIGCAAHYVPPHSSSWPGWP